MIYFCADDFGLCTEGDKHITECVVKNAINKISILTNVDLENLLIPQNVYFGAHINIVEGKAVSNSADVKLLTDKYGNFKYSFIGLFLKSLLPGRKKLEKQLYTEISNQLKLFKTKFPDKEFSVDTHQHTHMIPLVFKVLIKVIEEEKIPVNYVRIPAEPTMPYIKAFPLYFTYSIANIIKHWLIKFLWIFARKYYNKTKIKSAVFMGILFSGKMDKNRIEKVLPYFKKFADKKNLDIELLFHPGYIKGEIETKFKKFYKSSGRHIEFESVLDINTKKERSVI